MNRSASPILAASAALLLAQAAHAQTEVKIFGTADGGVRHLSNVNAAGDSKTIMGTNGWNSSNKLDFAGREELGGGLEAHFLLENGFNLATGALDNTTGTFFQRQSFVGLKGAWGAIDLGRQYTISHDFILDYDPFRFNYTPLIPLTQASSGTRFSNDVKYTGDFGRFRLELENSFGEVAGSNSSGSARGIGLQYMGEDLIAGGSYNRRSVLVGTTYRNEDYYLVGAAWKHGSLGLSGGYMLDTIDMEGTAPNTATRNAFGGASWSFTEQLKLTGGFYRTTSSTDKARGKDMTIVGLDYSLSKRTKLYLEADRNKWKTKVVSTLNAAGVSNQTGVTMGINHRF
ncbi:porin [Pelomonas sp. KK5]|uniref:porin n=1 Tax=Pelomonas sp. KK5 TaxID=1855730 RepID=UPI00097C8BD2|nr:porin [Pelomonas sp. KK5]